MKKLLPILMLLAVPAFGQLALQTVNTSNLQTNVVTSTKVISIPGIITNGMATVVETNVFLGDTLAAGFGKVNANKDLLKSVLRTNGATANGQVPFFTNNSTGYGWMPPGISTNGGTNGQIVVIDPTVPGGWRWSTNLPSSGGGGGTGTDTNAVRIYSGGATNLTVTNTLTIISTSNLVSIASLILTNWPAGGTNTISGTFFPAGNGYFTNSAGKTISLVGTGNDTGYSGNPSSFGSDVATNSPYTNTLPFDGYASQVNLIRVTNNNDVYWYYPIDPLHMIFVATKVLNNGTGTNFQGILVSGAGIAAANQVYRTTDTNISLTTIYHGLTDTNWNIQHAACGSGGTWGWMVINGSQGYFMTNGGVLTIPPIGTFGAPNFCSASTVLAPTAVYESLTNHFQTNVFLAYYSTNAWRFWSSTNVVNISTPTNTITGTNINQIYYVTNITLNPVTNATATNGIYTTLDNTTTNTVTFYGLPNQTSGLYFSGYIPGMTNLMVVTWTNATVITNGSTPPAISGGPCADYVTVAVSNDCRTLPDGMKMLQECTAYNSATHVASSFVALNTNNTVTASWFILGTLVKTIPWSDWTPNVPFDSCKTCQQTAITILPCVLGGGFNPSSGGGGGLGNGQIIHIGGSN